MVPQTPNEVFGLELSLTNLVDGCEQGESEKIFQRYSNAYLCITLDSILQGYSMNEAYILSLSFTDLEESYDNGEPEKYFTTLLNKNILPYF